MATQGGRKKLPAKTSVPSSDFYIPPLPVDVAVVRKSVEEDIVAWIACCVLIALLLPLMGFLYLDILETKNEAKAQVEKVEKMRQKIEQKEREKDK
jgi:nitric oxide reductase large subunit